MPRYSGEEVSEGATAWANDGKNAEAWEQREYDKHRNEWAGNLTKAEYTKIGTDLLGVAGEQEIFGQNVDVKVQPWWGGARYLVYDHTTNTLGVYTETGAIVTIYRPLTGRNYIVNQPGKFVPGFP